MEDNLKKKKKNILKSVLLGLLVGVLVGGIGTVSYAMFTYNSSSINNKLVVGDIYMRYKENNSINFTNAMPTNTYVANQYFEFQIIGKNTNTTKDIIYDIVLAYGDDHGTRNTRIRDDLLRFRLVEVVNNVEQEIFDDRSYTTINNTRIHKARIPASTNSEITHRYRLYAWITNETIIGNTSNADYSTSKWDDVYASVKVNVTGDFTDKEVQQVLYDIVKTGATSDSGIHFYEINGTDNGNGNFVRSTTTSDQYPIYYYRGNVDDNNVIFANKCWKIVRTTETGGTKMIYNGEINTIYNGMEQSNFTIVTNTGGWTFDTSDNTWNVTITSNDGAEISFKVPSGNGYTLEMTGTTGSSSGGSYYFFKDGSQVYEYGGGGGQPLAYTQSYGTLTGDNVVKFSYSGTGSAESPITFKLKMTNPSCEVLGINCDNSGNLTFLPTTQAWNSSYKSPAYVGYNYGTTSYEYSNTNDWVSGAKFGSSYIWNGTSYTLVDATETTPNPTHHYSCNEADANATCSNLRYVYYMSGSTKCYITLQNGKGVEDALKEMLSESTDTIKSPIHETINSWYNTNIKTTYGTYVEDTIWCNDRSVSDANLGGWKANGGALNAYMYFDVYKRYQAPTGTNGIQTTNSPVLTCSNANDRLSVANGKLENPVALLTYDEANLAGLIYNSSNYCNYLLVGNYYWLLSPAYFYSSYALVGGVGDVYNYYLTTDYVYNAYPGVRPALSLKHGTLVYDGDGSVSNPYIAGTPRT